MWPWVPLDLYFTKDLDYLTDGWVKLTFEELKELRPEKLLGMWGHQLCRGHRVTQESEGFCQYLPITFDFYNIWEKTRIEPHHKQHKAFLYLKLSIFNM